MGERRPDLDQLRRISEALDGDGPMPDELDADGAAFLAGARHLRSRLRIEEAAVPPDVTDAVLARLRDEGARPASGRERPLAVVAAAVFVVAALAAALVVRPGGPLAPVPALADVGDEVLGAQRHVTALDAVLSLVERGAHPDVPVRRYEGALRYRAPERLWLHLDDRSELPDGFPPNDLDLVVDEGLAWSRGLRGCPVGDQPACLGSSAARLATGLAPFAADWVAPLDLVVPADAFLPGADVGARRVGDAVVVETTVARVERTIEALRTAGALRAVHPTDVVRLELDDDAFTIRRLTVSAGSSGARTGWAATNGYAEQAGTEVLDLTVTERPLPSSPFPGPPAAPSSRIDAGFDDAAELAGPVPGWLPDGFVAHRSGVLPAREGTTTVWSWTDGRAWIRLDVTADRTTDELLGNLGPLVRRLPLGDGVGYTDPGGSVVSVHAADVDAAVTGSVPLDVLVRVGASLPVEGRTIPGAWPQGRALAELPAGALGPDGPLVARYDGRDLLVAVPGPGRTSAVLRQRPGTSLGPPRRADVAEVRVRGRVGRHEPGRGLVRWVEDGWVRELRSDGLALDELLAVAEELA